MPRAVMACCPEVWIWAGEQTVRGGTQERDGFAEVWVEVGGRLVASSVWHADELMTPEGLARFAGWWRGAIKDHLESSPCQRG